MRAGWLLMFANIVCAAVLVVAFVCPWLDQACVATYSHIRIHQGDAVTLVITHPFVNVW